MELQVFNNEEFGEIRTTLIDGQPWFVGKDLAKALGYKDTVNALKSHVDDDDKAGWQFTTHFGTKEMTIINESGLYSLILSSKLPTARQFKRWVTSEVLPAIRMTGGYVVDGSPAAHYIEELKGSISELRSQVSYLTEGFTTCIGMINAMKPVVNSKKLNTWKSQVSKPLVEEINTYIDETKENLYKKIYSIMQSDFGFNRSYAITSFCEKYNIPECSVIDAIADDLIYQKWFVEATRGFIKELQSMYP